MPIYEYRCQSCHREFQLLRPMDRAQEDALCLHCNGRAVRRLSVFAPIMHGSGGLGDLTGSAEAGACGCGGACACGASVN